MKSISALIGRSLLQITYLFIPSMVNLLLLGNEICLARMSDIPLHFMACLCYEFWQKEKKYDCLWFHTWIGYLFWTFLALNLFVLNLMNIDLLFFVWEIHVVQNSWSFWVHSEFWLMERLSDVLYILGFLWMSWFDIFFFMCRLEGGRLIPYGIGKVGLAFLFCLSAQESLLLDKIIYRI